MPETCSPEVSPAVVRLEALGVPRSAGAVGDPFAVHSVDQQGMRFEPHHGSSGRYHGALWQFRP